jgi:hypothetical protein
VALPLQFVVLNRAHLVRPRKPNLKQSFLLHERGGSSQTRRAVASARALRFKLVRGTTWEQQSRKAGEIST